MRWPCSPASTTAAASCSCGEAPDYRAVGDEDKANADVLEIAERDLSLPLELQAEGAQLCNNVAWLRYLMVSEKQRDPQKAVALAEKAIRLDPDDWALLNTLGVAYYRLGNYPRALEAFERSLRDSRDEAAAFDLFFLAMCHHRLGNESKARDEYEAAVRWAIRFEPTLNNPDWRRELSEFQSEAKAVLAKQTGARPEKFMANPLTAP